MRCFAEKNGVIDRPMKAQKTKMPTPIGNSIYILWIDMHVIIFVCLI